MKDEDKALPAVRYKKQGFILHTDIKIQFSPISYTILFKFLIRGVMSCLFGFCTPSRLLMNKVHFMLIFMYYFTFTNLGFDFRFTYLSVDVFIHIAIVYTETEYTHTLIYTQYKFSCAEFIQELNKALRGQCIASNRNTFP